MEEFYHLNAEPLLSLLADDCVWLSIGNLLISGTKAIRAEFKNGFIMPTFELEEPQFRQIETGKKLPVPKMRYMQIRDDITSLFKPDRTPRCTVSKSTSDNTEN